jgi:selenocysteine-specific elongation factor
MGRLNPAFPCGTISAALPAASSGEEKKVEPMKQVVLGTAGHIDHGKTSLIRALTGIDTDRLKEEKLRGITIELGFAHLGLPNGDILGIVDVPGHERFVKHMVAGATGIDVVALVIAADEGVMPQTREHLEICQLLRVKKGLVVLTKIDLVDDSEWVEMVQEDIRDFLQGTFLEGSPIVQVSATTGEGIDALRQTLFDLVAGVEPRSTAGPFRLPIDRVFSMRGFGTVVTGTSVSGRLKVGDAVMVYPSGRKTKVRGLQVHNREVQQVLPGQRTAINLQGVDREAIERGDVAATPDSLLSSHMLDVELEVLSSAPRPVKNRQKFRFHTGTTENLATLVLLDRQELAPGERAFAQVRLDRPLAVLRGDRFVLRSYSPVMTVGGGSILHPVPKKHKGREKRQAAQALQVLQSGEDRDIVLWHVRDAAWAGVSENELAIRANISGKAFQNILQHLVSQKQVLLYDKDNRRLLDPGALSEIQAAVLDLLAAYHRQFPLKAGMAKEELAAQLPRPIDSRVYNYALRQTADEGRIVLEKEWVRLSTHKVDLTEEEQVIRRKIEVIYAEAGLQPPFFKEIAGSLPGNSRQHADVLEWMLSQDILVKVKEDLYFHTAAIDDLRKRLIAFLKEHGEITTPQFKEMTQASRKYTIPLSEYFDAQRVTIRVKDVRRLRETTA